MDFLAYRIFILLTFLANQCHLQLVEFFITEARLPGPSSTHAVLYDGQDSIWVIGNEEGYVVRYSLETEQVDTIAANFNFMDGSAVITKGGEILYFGGWVKWGGIQTNIRNYSTATNLHTIIGRMERGMRQMSAVWGADTQIVHMFGGTDGVGSAFNSIYRYNASDPGQGPELVGRLPSGRYSTGAAWDNRHRAAYIFGGTGHVSNAREILRHDKSHENATKLPTELPYDITESCAVYSDGYEKIYVVSEEGVLAFDPSRAQAVKLNVIGWLRIKRVPCTFVEKLNRIYIMGGLRTTNRSDFELDEISYLQLSDREPPTEPTTPTTIGTPTDPSLCLVADSWLPAVIADAAIVYDGQNSIYVIGGFNGSFDQQHVSGSVMKYSLESGTTVVVGTFIPTSEGSAFMLHGVDGDGDSIIHVGGHDNNSPIHRDEIYSYSIVHNNYKKVAELPWSVSPRRQRMAVAWSESDHLAYIYADQAIFRYSVRTGEILEVADIREPMDDPAAVFYKANVWSWVYTFGFGPGGTPEHPHDVMQFSPHNWEVSRTQTRLPYPVFRPCATLAEDFDQQIYAFGSQLETDGLIKFDPVRREAGLVVVRSWARMLTHASCVYIPKLQRLYIIGGFRSYSGEPQLLTSDVSYIQFSSPVPETPTSTSPDYSTSELSTEEANTTPAGYSTTMDTKDSGGGVSALFISLVVGGPLLVVIIVAILLYLSLRRWRTMNEQAGGKHFKRSKSKKFGRVLTQFLTEEEVKFFREGKPKLPERPMERRGSGSRSSSGTEILEIESIPYNTNFEVAKEDLSIDFGVKLGSGYFGIVYKGTVRHWKKTGREPVAVKTVRPNVPVEYFKALMSELKILAYVGHHEHVASLVGAYTGNIKKGELYVAVELCKVSLLQYLRDEANGYLSLVEGAQPEAKSFTGCTGIVNLVRWAQGIAAGMEFLAEKHVVHGDLACRNVLLTFDLHAKICDFGLARQLSDYSYISTHAVNRPWKWMAIESLEKLAFSSKSDVWAYGVTLWEMFSLGNVPYPCAAWNLDFLNQLVAGYRLPIPSLADGEIYDKMLECWSGKKQDRPSFGELKQFFADYKFSSE